ncbi:DUF3718 domain-containing protein [Thalassotalea litorea]|uniref:DUF3718 domain-containing protein n=1 Tax=Thalassotalea litorea TaxID=2020715 RepID=UPI003735A989
MKPTKLITAFIMCAIPASIVVAKPANNTATEFEFVAKDSSIATKTCIAAASNDVSAVKSNTRKAFDGNYRLLSHTLSCNGIDINRFAHSFGADDTNEFLNKRVSSQYRIDDSIEIIDISGSYPPLTGKVQVIVSGK